MNPYIVMQCRNMKSMVSLFNTSIIEAAKQDDGEISKEEAKIIERLQKASLKYLKDINEIVGADA